MRKLILLLTLLVSAQGFAFDYSKETLICMLKGGYDVGQDGKLISFNKKGEEGLVSNLKGTVGMMVNTSVVSVGIDTPISISRKTGVYENIAVNNQNWKITVLDVGSKQQSLKILSTSTGGYVHAQYLQADLYVSEPRKPLLIIDGGHIYTGYCE